MDLVSLRRRGELLFHPESGRAALGLDRSRDSQVLVLGRLHARDLPLEQLGSLRSSTLWLRPLPRGFCAGDPRRAVHCVPWVRRRCERHLRVSFRLRRRRLQPGAVRPYRYCEWRSRCSPRWRVHSPRIGRDAQRCPLPHICQGCVVWRVQRRLDCAPLVSLCNSIVGAFEQRRRAWDAQVCIHQQQLHRPADKRRRAACSRIQCRRRLVIHPSRCSGIRCQHHAVSVSVAVTVRVALAEC